MAEKQYGLALGLMELHAVYSALKLLNAGHEDAIKSFGSAHDKSAYNATKRALAKVETVVQDADNLKGI